MLGVFDSYVRGYGKSTSVFTRTHEGEKGNSNDYCTGQSTKKKNYVLHVLTYMLSGLAVRCYVEQAEAVILIRKYCGSSCAACCTGAYKYVHRYVGHVSAIEKSDLDLVLCRKRPSSR